jgi:hypothetical protein
MASGMNSATVSFCDEPGDTLARTAREPKQKKEFFMQMIRHAGVLIALLILPSSIQAGKDAQNGHKGFRAISVVPELKASHPIATITLSKDHETLTATEKLD